MIHPGEIQNPEDGLKWTLADRLAPAVRAPKKPKKKRPAKVEEGNRG